MKIALVAHFFSMRKGGLERYTVNLARALVAAGHAVHVFAHRWTPEPGLTFRKVTRFRLSSPVKNLSFAFSADRALARHRFDVVQSMDRIWRQDIFRASDGVNPVQMLEGYPNPLIRKMNALGPRRQVLTLLEKRIFEGGGARFVMVNSELIKQQILQYYNADPERIAVIRNSVDTARFHPGLKTDAGVVARRENGMEPGDILLLFAGNDFKRKGLKLLLHAIARLSRPEVRLMVAGSDDPSSYARIAMELGIRDRVWFAGPRRDMATWYAAADLMVLPTRYDAFANVCLEAMACGTPVVTTRTNGASEIVSHGETGWVLETWEVDELATRLAASLAPDFRERSGALAAKTAGRFTMARHLSALMDLYARVQEDRAAC